MAGSAAPPPNAVEWLRAHAVTVSAVMLILIQLWLKGALLAGGYFHQDDYQYLDRAVASGFGWSYAMVVDAGHLLPLGLSIAWLQARAGVYDWPLAVGVVLLLLAAASLAMLHMLRTLFGNRRAILIPLGIYLFSPLSLAGSGWWSIALEILPLEAAMFMAVASHVRYLRGGRLRHAVAATAWLAAGMAAMDKGAVVPVLLFALTAAFFVARPADAFRYWRAWALYGALLAGYAAIFFSRLPTSNVQPGNPGPAGNVISLIETMLGSNLLPGALGGPWRWIAGPGYALAAPPAGLQWLSWAIALIVVIVTCLWRARAWRAWAILIGWIALADIAPVVLGRLGTLPGVWLGAETRYLTDATGVLALCAGLALLPVTADQPAYRIDLGSLRRPLTALTAALACAAAVGSIWSLESLQSTSNAGSAASRSYIATARAAIADVQPGAVIVDKPVPAFIMEAGLFWNSALTSQVIGPTVASSRHVTWTQPHSLHGVYADPLAFDGQGRLRPVILVGTYNWPPPRQQAGPYAGRSCWNITPADTRIPLVEPAFRFAWTIRVTYTGPAQGLAVGFGGTWNTVWLPGGTHVAYIPVTGSGNAVDLHLLADGGSTCVTGVTVGNPQPDEYQQGIPATPVAG